MQLPWQFGTECEWSLWCVRTLVGHCMGNMELATNCRPTDPFWLLAWTGSGTDAATLSFAELY